MGFGPVKQPFSKYWNQASLAVKLELLKQINIFSYSIKELAFTTWSKLPSEITRQLDR